MQLGTLRGYARALCAAVPRVRFQSVLCHRLHRTTPQRRTCRAPQQPPQPRPGQGHAGRRRRPRPGLGRHLPGGHRRPAADDLRRRPARDGLTCAVDQTTDGSHVASEYGRYELSARDFGSSRTRCKRWTSRAACAAGRWTASSRARAPTATAPSRPSSSRHRRRPAPSRSGGAAWRRARSRPTQRRPSSRLPSRPRTPASRSTCGAPSPNLRPTKRRTLGMGIYAVVFANVDGPVDTMVIDGEQLVGHDVTIGVYQRAEVTTSCRRLDRRSSARSSSSWAAARCSPAQRFGGRRRDRAPCDGRRGLCEGHEDRAPRDPSGNCEDRRADPTPSLRLTISRST